MVTKIYIVRHGETEWNRANKLQGWDDSPLTERGKRQAETLRKKLREVEFDAVYCSPLGRVMKTAKIALDGSEHFLNKDERLKEINMGQFEGTESKEIREEFPTLYSDFWENPQNYEPEDGENFHELEDRVASFLEEILEKHEGEKVLIFSHGIASKVMISYLEERPLSELWDTPALDEASLNVVEIEEEKCEVIEYGDTSFH